MSVLEAVERDLAGFGPVLAESGLAASARALAAILDDSEPSSTSKSMCAKELRETLNLLRSLAPPVETRDRVDDLAGRRAARRASGGAGA